MRCASFIVLAQIVGAVRLHGLESQTTVDPSDETCVLKTCAGAAGHYKVQGEDARRLSRSLHPQQYFVGSSCQEVPTKDASASVVQWLDAQDPIKNSSIAIYVNPLNKNLLEGKSAKLCANENGRGQCLCKLSGNTQFEAFRWLVFVMPSVVSQRWLAMQLRCPSGVADLFTGAVLLFLLPIAIISPYAAWTAWSAAEPHIPMEWKSVQVKSPILNFVDTFSWSAGFLMSLAGLQMGTLLIVRKSSREEAFVWFIAAFPAILAVAGALRLSNVMCKTQLAHACLGQGCVLTKPNSSSYLDFALLTILILYLAAVLWSVSSSFMGTVMALVALSGSTWALLKAIQLPRALEEKLKTLEVDGDQLAKNEVSNLKLIPWEAVVSAGRGRDNIYRFISETKKADGDHGDYGMDVNMGDMFWHGRAIFHLTGSRAGFLVLPSWVTLLMTFLIITADQLFAYSCSRGQLSDLQLTSSLHSLKFEPWQKTYEIIVDTSFRQVVMVASSDASNTQWISFTQPDTSSSSASQMKVNEHSSGAMVAEIHLAPHHVPRVAQVKVQGLRPSQDPTEYQVRFSPLMTLPTTVEIRADGFQQKVAWSTLPGSTISVPAGIDDFAIDVTLTDFVLGIPIQTQDEIQKQELWTRFEKMSSANDTVCSTKCHDSLTCFDYFHSNFGCFFVEGNSHLEADRADGADGAKHSMWSSALSVDRKLSGDLYGCKQTSTANHALGKCPDAGAGVLLSNGLLQFRGIKPDWRGSSATIWFSLILEVGGQRFQSKVSAIELRQGAPLPNDAIGILLGESHGKTTEVDCNFSIDLLGNVVVHVSKFDPMNFSSMNLSVMPLVPDPAFVVDWELEATEQRTPMNLTSSTKCRESAFLRERYEACGASHGSRAKPIIMAMNTWTGRLRSASHFTVKNRVKDKVKVQLSEPHRLVMNFGVDSPAAWAAETHQCDLLNSSSYVQRSLLESADSTCALLSSCSTETLCSAVRQSGLGREEIFVPEKQKWEYLPPLLPPQGVVKVLGCLRSSACKDTPTKWKYDEAEPFVLRLKGFGAKVPVKSLVEQLEQMEEDNGLAWLQAMQVFDSSDAWPVSFDQALAKMAWEFGELSSLPKLLRVLGTWKRNLPQLLLNELVNSRRMELAELPEVNALRKIFSTVKALEAQLVDAAQLSLTVLATQLTENLESLTVTCFQCNKFAKSPSARDLSQLSTRLAKIKHLRFADFILKTPEKLLSLCRSLQTLLLPRNQLTKLPTKVFHGLSKLTKLELYSNQLAELPNKVFQGLSNLKELFLYNNQLTELPTGIFQGLSNLKMLSLGSNQFAELPKKVFQGLSNLTILGISKCQLTKLPKEVFHGLSKLTVVYLYKNQLAELPKKVFQGLSNLKELYLYNNQLTELPTGIFHGLSNLTMLGLGSNQFAELPKELFQGLPNLRTKDARDDKDDKLPKVFSQYLSGNTLPNEVSQGPSNLTKLKVMT